MSWIDIDEKLPDNTKEVLCTDGKLIFIATFTKGWEIEVEDDEPEPGQYDMDEKDELLYLKAGWYEEEEQYRAMYDYNWFKRKVTHWQPLPERP